MILWPVMDQGPSQVLPLSLPSLRPYFSRTASPRAARTAHRRRKLSVQAGGAGQGVRARPSNSGQRWIKSRQGWYR